MKSIAQHIIQNQKSYFFAVCAMALALVTLRVVGAPPAIMPDEYQYSLASRHLAMSEAQIPNYLFYWVYSLTSIAGTSFYTAAKFLNIIFLAGTSFFTYASARRFTTSQLSAYLAVLIFVGPLSTYTSFFMPESMEFFAISVIVWYLLGMEAASSTTRWLGLGALLGLASLVKPHALFLMPAIILYLGYLVASIPTGKIRKLLSASIAFVGGTLAVKFALGLAFAGTRGLTLFGATYSSSLTAFTSGATSTATQTEGGAQAASAGAEPIFLKFLEVTTSETLAHLAAAVFLYGFPLALLVSTLPAAIRDRKSPTRTQQLTIFATVSLLVLILVVATFTAMLTVQGTDHSSRIMLRYYDFLMPILVIAGLALITPIAGKASLIQVIAALAASGLIIFEAVTNFSPYQPQFFDSPALQGTSGQQGFTWLFAAVAVGALITSLFPNGFARKVYLFGSLPLLLFVSGFLAFSPIAKSVQINDYDRAAAFASQHLSPDELKTMTVVAPQQNLMMRALFEIDNPGVDYKLVNPGDNFGFQYLAPGKQWVLEIGQTHSSEPASVRINGNGFTLLKVQTSPEYFFSSPLGSNFVTAASGLGVSEPSGAWTLGNTTTLKFDQMLPVNAKVRLTFEASASLSGKTSQISLGNSSLAIQAQTSPIDGVLEFHNTEPANSIVISTEMPKTPKEMGLSQDTRPVGYKLIYIGLETK